MRVARSHLSKFKKISILGQLEKKGYQVFPRTIHRNSKKILGSTAATLSEITAVKKELALMRSNVELGTEHRAKTQLDRTAGDFVEAIEVFAREYLPKSKLPAKSGQ